MDTHLQELVDHPLLAGLEDPGSVAARFRMRVLRAGEVLVHEGDPGDAVYVLLAGRCRAHSGDVEYQRLGRGAVIGEVAVLAALRRTASVTALRDSLVAELTLEALEELATEQPAIWRSLGACAARAAAGRPLGEERGEGTLVLALFSLGTADVAALARGFVDALAPCCSVTLLQRRPDAPLEDIERVEAAERANDVVVWIDPSGDREWVGRAALHADAVVAVAAAGDPPRAAPTLPEGATLQLVRVHPGGTLHATGTGPWLDLLQPHAHHNLREGDACDLGRVTRLLTGRGTGVSLSGGAARAIAHFGLLQSIEANGLAVDCWTGSSAGGAIAACLASGMHHTEARTVFAALLECMRPATSRLHPPISGLMSGAAPVATLQSVFGDRAIEDLWTPLQVPATDLVTGERFVFRRGPLWRAVRATGSLPFFWPPLIHASSVLVDAGLVCNQPVDLLLDGCRRGLLVAADFRPPENDGGPWQRVDDADTISGWRMLWAWLRRRAQPIPTVSSVLLHAMTLGDVRERGRLAELERDLPLIWMRPAVPRMGFFTQSEQAQEACIEVYRSYADNALSAVRASSRSASTRPR
jgi:NTE family protein